MQNFTCIHEKDYVIFKSASYNFLFDKITGKFARFGETPDEDPQFSPFGPEILDMEIVSGTCLGHCKFCYKCNGVDTSFKYMSLKQAEHILKIMPKTLTQVAYGITDIYANPDFFDILKMTRIRGIVPNYTCHGLDTDANAAKITAEYCGAVAVSIVNQEATYDAIEKFVNAGMKQVNIHYMLSQETYDRAFRVIHDIKNDSRLRGLNAIVFLSYKEKGNGVGIFNNVSYEQFSELMKVCEKENINFGMDSCSAPLYIRYLYDSNNLKNLQFIEPCESGLFSSYINVDMEFFPCSFMENIGEWKQGIKLEESKSFFKDVWTSDRLLSWRENLLGTSKGCLCDHSNYCRVCPQYKINCV